MLYLQVAPLTFHKHINYETSILEFVAYSCCKQNKDMNEMNDAHAYEMQCNYGSQTPKLLQYTTQGWRCFVRCTPERAVPPSTMAASWPRVM
jgi:hypothetical protein